MTQNQVFIEEKSRSKSIYLSHASLKEQSCGTAGKGSGIVAIEVQVTAVAWVLAQELPLAMDVAKIK